MADDPPPSYEEVAGRLRDLINGAVSRSDASRWASRWATDDNVEVDPAIWRALEALSAADLSGYPDREWLFGEEDFRAWLGDLEA